MPELPRGVPYIDILAPAGTAAKAEDIQTRLDLIGATGWLVKTDDGTMEHSAVPMQPLRGTTDRLQVYRQQPLMPGEPLSSGAQLAVELALQSEAHVAALGVYGVYAWGLVAIEDIRWLHGLMLLDWIYNPRIDERGEIIEGDDPRLAEAAVPKKMMAFAELWTPEQSALLSQKMPEGALQTVETHLVLSLLGPGGTFDPRFWQSVALQLGLDAVRTWAGTDEKSAEGDAPAPPPSSAGGPLPSKAPPAPTPAVSGSSAAAPVGPPDDGLTPLARARLEAERRAVEAAARGEEDGSEDEASEDEVIEGGAIQWCDTDSGLLLWVPTDRLEASWLRELRRGSTSGLARSERPSGELLEAWVEAGAPFATELSSMARLMLDNVPLHKGSWEAAAEMKEGFSTLVCHLPRVARVVGVYVPSTEETPRRILVSSDLQISAAKLVATAG
jgi:hypothetical protein